MPVINEEASVMRNITTAELVHEMGYGINIGNTFEACGDWINGTSQNDYERAWGSPTVTQKMIQGYADAGFGVLRIPVSWSNMMKNDGTYTICPELMARIKEVVSWSLDTGIYVIINVHWDNGWFRGFGRDEDRDECMRKYERLWKQISEEFKACGDKLMFEAMNEEGDWKDIWNRYSKQGDKEKLYEIFNSINRRFVEIIRSSGGNNPKRHLLIPGPVTDIDLTCDKLFKMPDDPAQRMAVSVHYYNPPSLTICEKDESWGKALTEWGSKEDISELEKYVNMIKETFIDKGIPVIVGEYGCFGKNKKREVNTRWMLTVSKAMYEAGACPVLWDTPYGEYDRDAAVFKDPGFIEELIKPSGK